MKNNKAPVEDLLNTEFCKYSSQACLDRFIKFLNKILTKEENDFKMLDKFSCNIIFKKGDLI